MTERAKQNLRSAVATVLLVVGVAVVSGAHGVWITTAGMLALGAFTGMVFGEIQRLGATR